MCCKDPGIAINDFLWFLSVLVHKTKAPRPIDSEVSQRSINRPMRAAGHGPRSEFVAIRANLNFNLSLFELVIYYTTIHHLAGGKEALRDKQSDSGF